ncbi:MAG TPA: hypothetical protein DIC26_08310 [Pseudomonas sp.]|nr:hypothetical protein [Pseudomonas sp.]
MILGLAPGGVIQVWSRDECQRQHDSKQSTLHL